MEVYHLPNNNLKYPDEIFECIKYFIHRAVVNSCFPCKGYPILDGEVLQIIILNKTRIVRFCEREPEKFISKIDKIIRQAEDLRIVRITKDGTNENIQFVSCRQTEHIRSLPNFDQDIDEMMFSEDTCKNVIVMEFAKNVDETIYNWIIKKIQGETIIDRAIRDANKLFVIRSVASPDECGPTIHISATTYKLLLVAEELGIMKLTNSGLMKHFKILSLNEFVLSEDMKIDDLLTYAERQIIVTHSLENIRAQQDEPSFPGAEHYMLYHGQSIIHAAIENDIITNIYSIHDQDALKKFGAKWYRKTLIDQPIQKIRDYFGESIAFYFAFIGFYTIALFVPLTLGIIQSNVSSAYHPVVCIFNVIWMTVFTELWKRRASTLSYKWGTITMTDLDTPRAGHYGKIGRDHVTGKMTPVYPLLKTYLKLYFISWPVISVCLAISSSMCMFQFWVENLIAQRYGDESYLMYLPTVVQAVIIYGLTYIYEYLATWLTDRENHRTQQLYEEHRIYKLIILESVNNFLPLFYIAFILKDLETLRSQLMIQLIVVLTFQNLAEFICPMIKRTIFKQLDRIKLILTNRFQSIKNAIQAPDSTNQVLIQQELKHQTNRHYEDYKSTYDDYLELYIQFGYVMLFSMVAPFAAFCALLNNIVEIHLDAYKLCKIYKRPIAKRAKGIGAWLLAFQIISVLSIVTNSVIILMTPETKSLTSFNDYQWVLLVVFMEHLMFIVTWIIHRVIPDCPQNIKNDLAKLDYQTKQNILPTTNTSYLRNRGASQLDSPDIGYESDFD